MDASHTKIVKIWCKNCFFYVKKYPIPICIIILFFLSYIFMPLVYTVLIYSSPLVGISFLVHKFLLGIDSKKVKKSEQDDKRKKFAKSRRSFKSMYGDRNQLNRRNTKMKNENFYYSDTDFSDSDDIFSKSLNELLGDRSFLIDEKPTKFGEVNLDTVVGRGESSSSSYNYHKYDNVKNADKDEREGGCWDRDDQNNKMDNIGLLETDRNKRLEGLMERRRSKKNLGYKDKGETGNNNNAQVSAIKVVKMNPFLGGISCGNNTPGSAPSALLATHNPFDLPYDPHEEKPDLSGDDFHEEFIVSHHKEPMFCRHQSFSLGAAFSHPDASHDNRDMSFYRDLASKRFTLAGLAASTVVGDGEGGYKHIPISDDSIQLKREGESSEDLVGLDSKTKEIDEYIKASVAEGSCNLQRNDNSFDCGPSTMLEERKADISFFYGSKRRLGRHVQSNSIVSDLQVELSDEETSLKELELDRERGSWLNLSNLSKVSSEVSLKPDGEEDHTNSLSDNNSVVSADLPSSSTQEIDNRPHSLDSDTVESNQLQESSGAAADGLTDVAIRQAHVASSSPKSVLERGLSTDQASPYHFANEVQQTDNHT